MRINKWFTSVAGAGLGLMLGFGTLHATDWPMWRYESNRSAISPEQLSDSLYLQWVISNPAPMTAWDNQREQDAYGSTTDGVTAITGKISNDKKFQSFDIAYQPVVMGTTMFYGSPNDDKITAVNATTGAELWHFFADAPIRMAPVAKNGKVFFGADDGYMYCLNATNGAVVWKVKAAPNTRKVMGNDRLMSVWPVRGAPVIPSGANSGTNPAFTDWKGRLTAATSPYVLMAASDFATELVKDSTVATAGATAEMNYDKKAGNLDIVGLRFANEFYTIPQGATIDSAFIQFSVKDTAAGATPCTLSIAGESADNSAAFTSVKGGISSRTKTTAVVTWIVPSWTSLKARSADQRTPDLKSIVQEVVNRTGWTARSHISLIVNGTGGTGVRGAYPQTTDTLQARLCIYSGAIASDTLTTRPNPIFTFNNADTNTVFFTAGLYPFEGVFVYALNADNGTVVWINDGSSMNYTLLPHGTDEGFSGLAPQGYLCTAGDSGLVVPNGRTNPAFLTRTTGLLNFIKLNGSGGGYHVVSQGQKVYCAGTSYNLADGSSAGSVPAMFQGDLISITAGTKTYTAGSISDTLTTNYSVTNGTWTRSIAGKPAGLAAANGMLFVTTTNGKIYCFGPTNTSSPTTYYAPTVTTATDASTAAAADLITRSGYKTGSRGICIAVGLTNGRLIEELARQSDLTVIGLDTSATKVNAIRDRIDSTGLYGNKVHVICGDVRTAGLPKYVAQLIVTEDVTQGFPDLSTKANDYVAAVYRSLRPYGGIACLPISQSTITAAVAACSLSNAQVASSGSFTLLTKAGALAGSGDWSSQYCNAAHTNFVKDSLVKAPMGLLWFGGSMDNTNDKMNTRHGHGPTEQVVGGRYYMQGPNTLRCVDAYTGRVLWEKTIQHFGEFSEYTEHEAGQIALGDNYVSTPEAIYALGDHDMNLPPKSLLVLDPATGATKNTITLPDSLGSWGFISIADSFLIATTQPMMFDSAKLGNGFIYWYSGTTSIVGVGGINSYNGAVSNRIVVLNRFTGAQVWDTKSEAGFSNTGIVTGNGKVFAIDRTPAKAISLLEHTGTLDPKSSIAKIKAFDLKTGHSIWTDTASGIFGLYLAYSADYDMLLEASRLSRDYLYLEPAANHMIARKGADGTRLWSWADTTKSYYGGPVMLDDTLIITQDGNNFGMVNLKSGKFQQVNFGMTDKPIDFYFYRHYGCNYGLGATNMICFRSGSGSYYDLSKMDGVANFGGFKTGCTPSVVPADGIVTSAEYTRTCSCHYSIQTSCAMVYDPDVEKWTCNDGLATKVKNVGFKYTNIGVNLGGVGDRKDDNGTLWMDYPTGEDKVGFPAYLMPLSVTVAGDSIKYFRHHSSRVTGSGPKWVASSGAENVSSVTVAMYKDSVSGTTIVPHTTTTDLYNVTLYFMEHKSNIAAGQRVFNVSVNGVSAASNLDIVNEAGAAYKIVTKTVNNVPVGDNLVVALTASAGKPILSGFSATKVVTTAVRSVKMTMNSEQMKQYTGNGNANAPVVSAVKNGVNAGIEAGLNTK